MFIKGQLITGQFITGQFITGQLNKYLEHGLSIIICYYYKTKKAIYNASMHIYVYFY